MIANLRPTAMKPIRERKGITKAALARAAGMQAGTITWIEDGRFVPYDSQLAKLADALEVDDPKSLIELVD